jgi:hypothetical protein
MPGALTPTPRGVVSLLVRVFLVPILVAPALAGPLHAQSGGARGGPRFESELGASMFFGNTEQVTFTNRSSFSQVDSTMEFSVNWNVTYGEATNEEGETFVNRRTWSAGSSLDFLPHSRVSPFLFGTVEYSLQKRIDQRFSGGAGGKLTLVRSTASLLDVSAAALVERTVPRDRLESETELLARWSVRMRARRSFDGDRFSLSTENLYVPAFRDAGDFTFTSTSSISLAVSTRVSVRFSFVDSYDSGAIDRGARTNNDGQLLFSILTRF